MSAAVQTGAASVVEFLLTSPDLKTDPNVRDSEQHTPLHLVCGIPREELKFDHIRCTQLLLQHGADPAAVDEDGLTRTQL